jgi:plastocyanin
MMADPRRILLATGLLLASSCAEELPPPPPPGAIPAGEVLGSGVITGTAILEGEPPPPETINMDSDSVCATIGKGRAGEDLVVDPGGGLRNVFVYAASGFGDRIFAPPATPVVLDQNGCAYEPHVLGVQVGQILEIRNSDATLHNVHARPEENRGFNVGMAMQRSRIRKFFSLPEVMIRMNCDVHSWMSAYVGVLDHPFFDVTGEEGSFTLTGLPPGEYVVQAWHERLGTQSVAVRLEEGEKKGVRFEFRF